MHYAAYNAGPRAEPNALWATPFHDRQKHRKRYEAEDLTAEHNAGSIIVAADERATRDFGIYKGLGGTAPSPQAVIRDLKNPCGGTAPSVKSL